MRLILLSGLVAADPVSAPAQASFPALPSLSGLDILGRLGRLPLSLTQLFTGSYESILGGVNLPRDSRVYQAFLRLSYLEQTLGSLSWQGWGFPLQGWWQGAPSQSIASSGRSPTSALEYYMRPSDSSSTNCTGYEGPVSSISEIDNWTEAQLACLLRNSKAPEKLDTGLYYGRIESWLGSEMLRDFGQAISGGTILARTKCDGLCADQSNQGRRTERLGGGSDSIDPDATAGVTDDSTGDCENAIKVGFTQFGLAASAPSYNYISSDQHAKWPLYPPEDINGDWWWMDWSVDMKKVCPSRLHRFYDAASGGLGGISIASGGSGGISIGGISLNVRPLQLTGGPWSGIFASQQYTAGQLNNVSQLVRDRVAQIRVIGYDDDMRCRLYLGRFLTLFPEGFRVTAFFSFAKLIM